MPATPRTDVPAAIPALTGGLGTVAGHPLHRAARPDTGFSADKLVPLTGTDEAPRAKRFTETLPVIDIAPMFGDSLFAQRRVAEEIGAAAREAGFLYVKNHGIATGLIEDAYVQAERFFSLSIEEKLECHIARSFNHRGYVPVTERGLYADEQGKRRYEAFDTALDLPDFVGGQPLLGPNVWPGVDGFQNQISAYYRAVGALGKVLCRAFELHLKPPANYFDQFMTKPTSQLRLIHYLENDDAIDEQDMNMGAHTDYECFTILHQYQPGLQVMNADHQWMDAPPIDGTFAINIGDMLEVWTNGAFKSTLHRVVNNGRERYSMPYFVATDYDAVIEPLPGKVSAQQPPRYDKLVAGQHLMGQLYRDFGYLRERHAKGALKLDFPIPQGNPFEQVTPSTPQMQA